MPGKASGKWSPRPGRKQRGRTALRVSRESAGGAWLPRLRADSFVLVRIHRYAGNVGLHPVSVNVRAQLLRIRRAKFARDLRLVVDAVGELLADRAARLPRHETLDDYRRCWHVLGL